MFEKILKPGSYHGIGKKAPFFEGWYFKLINKNRQEAIAIIPGIFLHEELSRSSAFVQVMDGKNLKTHFVAYPVDTFKAHKKLFDIKISGNNFTLKNISINIHNEGLQVSGNLQFQFLNPWPVTLFSPGIMGWYAWVPFMECFHGVLSMDHAIEGSLKINEREIDFSGGKGYIEKDWGQAFPEAWIWQQSNHFGEDGISLTASIAIIPWVRKAFPGFIIGILWEKQLYRFASYTGAKTKLLEIQDKTVHWVVEDKKYVMEMFSEIGPSTYLRAPTPNGMDRQINESIDSRISVRLSQRIKTGKTVIYQGNGHHAGFEKEGNISKLLEMVRNV